MMNKEIICGQRSGRIRIPSSKSAAHRMLICAAFGATVTYAKRLMHGKQSMVSLDKGCPLFRGCPDKVPVARYHSLAVDPETIPDALLITARTLDGEIMGVRHREYPVYGVQFHPESILTPDGKRMLANFLQL